MQLFAQKITKKKKQKKNCENNKNRRETKLTTIKIMIMAVSYIENL